MNPKKSHLILPLCLLMGLCQEALASIPLGAGRKTATGTVEMYGCLQANDYYIVNFAAYPVAATKAKKPVLAECVNLSEIGDTIISLDLLDRDVRKKKVALKVVDKSGRTLLETPYDLPKQGIVSAQVSLNQAGKYEALLFVEDTELNIEKSSSALHIPLTVAVLGAEPAAKNTMTGFFVLIGSLIITLAVLIPRLLKPASV